MELLENLRLLVAVLMDAVTPTTKRSTRVRRRGEVGMEMLQVVIWAAVASVIAVGAGLYFKNVIANTESKVQTP